MHGVEREVRSRRIANFVEAREEIGQPSMKAERVHAHHLESGPRREGALIRPRAKASRRYRDWRAEEPLERWQGMAPTPQEWPRLLTRTSHFLLRETGDRAMKGAGLGWPLSASSECEMAQRLTMARTPSSENENAVSPTSRALVRNEYRVANPSSRRSDEHRGESEREPRARRAASRGYSIGEHERSLERVRSAR